MLLLTLWAKSAGRGVQKGQPRPEWTLALSVEDLAQICRCDVRTVERELAALDKRGERVAVSDRLGTDDKWRNLAKRDLEIARLLGWYRIPLRKAPKVIEVDCLAFYQTAAFGEADRWRIQYVAEVRATDSDRHMVTRQAPFEVIE